MELLTKKVKELAQRNHVDYVGIAPVERFVEAPVGRRPTDLLEDAKSVIAIGIRLPKSTSYAQKKAFRDKNMRHVFYSYMMFGYHLVNVHLLDMASFLITKLLEDEGYMTLPIVASGIEDISSPTPGAFSHRHAAVAAGLGELGWHTIFLPRDKKGKVRLASIITTAELVPDPLYNGSPICDPKECRKLAKTNNHLCVDVCPMGALDDEEYVECRIDKKTLRYSKLDMYRSMWSCLGLIKEKGMGLKEIPPPEKIDFWEVINGMKERHPAQLAETMVVGRANYCGRCFNECPIGS